MQNEQEFYRCLVSDAAGRTLKKILADHPGRYVK